MRIHYIINIVRLTGTFWLNVIFLARIYDRWNFLSRFNIRISIHYIININRWTICHTKKEVCMQRFRDFFCFLLLYLLAATPLEASRDTYNYFFSYLPKIFFSPIDSVIYVLS